MTDTGSLNMSQFLHYVSLLPQKEYEYRMPEETAEILKDRYIRGDAFSNHYRLT